MATLAQRMAAARQTTDPERAAEAAWQLLRELGGGGGAAGELSWLYERRALGTALVAMRAGQERHQRRLAKADPEARAELERTGPEPYWSEAGRRFKVSHTRAREVGLAALEEARRDLGLPERAAQLAG